MTRGALLPGEPPGATPIDPDDLRGLIPTWIATRADLDQAEFSAIAQARPWAERQAVRLGPHGVLTTEFLLTLHGRMFAGVWRWAGQVRTRQTNLGVAPGQIRTGIRQVLDDARTWHSVGAYPIDARAIRLHHRLVSVHPFPNGNGRATRMFADLYLIACGEAPFSWASGAVLSSPTEARAAYLDALRAADSGDVHPLERFARA